MNNPNLQIATFGAGCFWGVEEAFRTTPGVIDTQVGYTGGTTENPTYEEVCGGTTGHAEVVQVEFDLETITYEQLLGKFWTIHDPTQENRQGPDIGTQYRSVIFCHDESQKAIAERSKQKLSTDKPVTTVIEPATTFYQAENYHQKYLAKKGLSTCPI